MRKIANTGKIYARCVEDKVVRVIKFRFEQEQLVFEFEKKKLQIKSDGVNLYCQITEQSTKESIVKREKVNLKFHVSHAKKSSAFCDSYLEAIDLLIEVNEKEPLRGQILIKDMPFIVSLYTTGFVFRCDLGTIELSYVVLINDRQIFVSRKQKLEKVQELNIDSMQPCESFTEALEFVYNSAYSLFKETISKPERLN